MTRSYTILVIRGIRINVDLTWLITVGAFSLLQYNFYADRFPLWTTPQLVVVAIVSVLLLFFFVLIHELAHSLMAQAFGIKVQNITLFLLGGVSNIQSEAKKPLQEFAIAVVGPLTNVVFFLVFWGIQSLDAIDNEFITALLAYGIFANIALAVFNMIPGLPLDGGRVLRSALWLVSGRMYGSAIVASVIGQIIGGLFILIALLGVVLFDTIVEPILNFVGLEGVADTLGDFFAVASNNILNVLWIALIGLFIFTSAASYRKYIMWRRENEKPPRDPYEFRIDDQ